MRKYLKYTNDFNKKFIIIISIVLILIFSSNLHAKTFSYLVKAIKAGDEDLVEDIIDAPFLREADVDVNQTSFSGLSPLMVAAESGRLEIAELLIDEGAAINLSNGDGYTALMYAALIGHFEMVELLVDEEAEINMTNNEGVNALTISLSAGLAPEFLGEEFKQIINQVYQNNSDLDIQNYTKISSFLINEGADTLNDEHYILLAVDSNEKEIIEALADNDYNIKDREIAKNSLILAMEKNNADLVKYIIECGADPDYLTKHKDGHEISLFHLAIANNSQDVVDEMIDGGANVNSKIKLKDESKVVEVSPLIYSIEIGRPQIAELLIKGDANPEEKIDIDNEHKTLIEGTTPLILAVKKNQMSVVKELIGGIIFSPKADINDKDGLGNNALMYAIKEDNYEMAEYLIDKEADVNSSNQKGETPLISAIKTQKLDFVELLIEAGANLEYSNSENKSPLDYANELENEEIPIIIQAAIINQKEESQKTKEEKSFLDNVKSGVGSAVDGVKSKAKDIID
jgi:ankyrin repeat protein